MIRHEYGLWSLLRTDKNLKYIYKSLVHRKQPATEADGAYFKRVHDSLAGLLDRANAVRVRPLESGDRLLSFSAVGDLMWIRSGWSRFLSPALQAHLKDRPLRFANLESPLHPNRPVKKYAYETFHYNAPLEYCDPWKTNGSTKTIFSLCNNHAMDQGLEGLRLTRSEVSCHSEFAVIGGTDESDAIVRIEHQNCAIACIGLTYATNHSTRHPSPPGIPKHLFGRPGHEPDWSAIARLIAIAKSQPCDLVVLLAHWGYEYEYWPERQQRDHARSLIEMGIDVILGSSPHVLQPIEAVSIDGWDERLPMQAKRGGPARCGLIAYSLGNFATVMPTLACRTGAILDADLRISKDGRIDLAGLSAHPTFSVRGRHSEWLDVRAFSVEELTSIGLSKNARLATRHAQRVLGAIVSDLSSHQPQGVPS